MIVGVPKEACPGERRVALVPAALPPLVKVGCEVRVEAGAGLGAGHDDEAYRQKGAVVASRDEVFAAHVVVQVHGYGSAPEASAGDLRRMRPGVALVGFHEPLTSLRAMQEVARAGATVLAMELIPRITRAQSMDALSSMATISGYRSVILAADEIPILFPMLTTAAGTVRPARIFVIGAGVAGLMAIATARRLGAIVEAYDVRPAVKEQVQSLGAKFVELPVESAEAEDRGGYAKKQDEAFYRKQRELMARVVAQSDVVIATAAVPGAKAPVLISAGMVSGMGRGSVIVDLAAERGGNCELTRPGETVDAGGVRILGPVNVPASVPVTASQLYAKNVATLLLHLVKDAALALDPDDEIVRDTMVTHGGRVTHPRVAAALEASGVA
jgi:NAD(P) transhydrogenase subunit alpha